MHLKNPLPVEEASDDQLNKLYHLQYSVERVIMDWKHCKKEITKMGNFSLEI